MTQAHTETRMSLCVLQMNKAPKQQARGAQLMMARLCPSAGLLFMWDPNIDSIDINAGIGNGSILAR